MTMYINRLNNTNYSWKYIRRLMRKLKIKSKIRRKRYNYIKVQPEQGMIQSMSRVGKCIDNGPMEAFWGTIKSEMYYIDKFYSIENLIQSIKDYIEFYNNKRFQAKLKCLAPMEYRNQALSA